MALIQLSDDLIIGKGRDRVCYQHPHNSELCIKVSKASDKQSLREQAYFTFLQKRKTDLSHTSQYRGTVNTDQGLGYCFDLIKDDDGQVSKTLTQHLKQQTLNIEQLSPLLVQLQEYLIRNRICVRDISPNNIVVEIKSSLKLVVIDGISNSSINPLTIRLPSLTTQAIKKSWQSLERKIQRMESSQS